MLFLLMYMLVQFYLPLILHIHVQITVGVVDCSKDGAEEVTCDVCREKFIRPISAHKFEKLL